MHWLNEDTVRWTWNQFNISVYLFTLNTSIWMWFLFSLRVDAHTVISYVEANILFPLSFIYLEMATVCILYYTIAMHFGNKWYSASLLVTFHCYFALETKETELKILEYSIFTQINGPFPFEQNYTMNNTHLLNEFSFSSV